MYRTVDAAPIAAKLRPDDSMQDQANGTVVRTHPTIAGIESCFSTERALLDQTCACRARVRSGRAAAKRPGATNPYGLDLEVRPKR